jgi:hypothetical protein
MISIAYNLAAVGMAPALSVWVRRKTEGLDSGGSNAYACQVMAARCPETRDLDNSMVRSPSNEWFDSIPCHQPRFIQQEGEMK